MRIVLFLAACVLCVTDAYAECMAIPDKTSTLHISKISAPVYNAQGNELKGCLLHSEGPIIGYATDTGLCSMRPGSNAEVRLSYGCCDTGPDSGDVECIVRTKSLLGLGGVHGNGVTVHPVGNVR